MSFAKRTQPTCRSAPARLWLLTSSLSYRLVMVAVCGSVSEARTAGERNCQQCCTRERDLPTEYIVGSHMRGIIAWALIAVDRCQPVDLRHNSQLVVELNSAAPISCPIRCRRYGSQDMTADVLPACTSMKRSHQYEALLRRTVLSIEMSCWFS